LWNLLPLCCWHHHAIHDRRWQLRLAPNRQLTIDYPDGTSQTTGPPKRGTNRNVKEAAPFERPAARAYPLRT